MRPLTLKAQRPFTSFTKRAKTILLCLIAAFPMHVWAWNYDSKSETTEQAVQLRAGADFTKHWKYGVKLSLSEEMRFDLFDQLNDSNCGAAFNKSYTSLILSYAPIEYIKVDAGYTMRILGKKNWSDYNEWLRHRVFFGVTGTYRGRYMKIYLRERVLCEMRTDSVNLKEKNQYNWLLRSRIGVEFFVPIKPVKPYLWTELENTLNVPEYQRKDGQQYIRHIRTQVGIKWRITRRSSLDFYYRFNYGYDRDINITKKNGYIQLTEEKSFNHAFGATYNLDW